MNKEETKAARIIMQAFEDGEEIEVYTPSGGGVSASSPCWNWNKYNYHIKPKPLVLWVNSNETGSRYVFDNPEEAKHHADLEGFETIKMQQVI